MSMQNAQTSRPPRVGLALGAGGARGWAHIGVLQRLDAMGIPIACIAGTSAGALVGCVYLAGQLDLLDALTLNFDWRQTARLLFEVNLPRSGLITGRHVERALQRMIQIKTFEELDRPFAAVATDLGTHREVVFKQGDLVRAIRASLSIPGILTPVRIGTRHLVDGVLVNPLPVSVLREMGAEVVIGVDVNLRQCDDASLNAPVPVQRTAPHAAAIAQRSEWLRQSLHRLPKRPAAAIDALLRKWEARQEELSIFDVLTQAMRITENQLTRSRLETDPPDILIQPAVGQIATLDFPSASQAIIAGARAADEKRHELEALLKPATLSKHQPPSIHTDHV